MSSIFSEMRRTKSSNITILNSVILLQYGPRVFQIYPSWKKLISAKKFNKASLWVKASLNLFLYILAGHVSLLNYVVISYSFIFNLRKC